MISVLHTAMLNGGDVAKAMDCYPKVYRNVDEESDERANKYWVMYSTMDDLRSKRYGSQLIERVNRLYFVCVDTYVLCGTLCGRIKGNHKDKSYS